ncbi:MAG: hypothetical protein JWP72_1851 [Massilia sp.]|nr:hypothetical protein [Massilia sp.]MDB5790459.1 hypothetical protein [Massilia sp.]
MNSHNLHPFQRSAHDALFDDIEHELLALTTASLDNDGDDRPAPLVDEFATEFLVELSRPPCSGRPPFA